MDGTVCLHLQTNCRLSTIDRYIHHESWCFMVQCSTLAFCLVNVEIENVHSIPHDPYDWSSPWLTEMSSKVRSRLVWEVSDRLKIQNNTKYIKQNEDIKPNSKICCNTWISKCDIQSASKVHSKKILQVKSLKQRAYLKRVYCKA